MKLRRPVASTLFQDCSQDINTEEEIAFGRTICLHGVSDKACMMCEHTSLSSVSNLLEMSMRKDNFWEAGHQKGWAMMAEMLGRCLEWGLSIARIKFVASGRPFKADKSALPCMFVSQTQKVGHRRGLELMKSSMISDHTAQQGDFYFQC